ncbi:MAG TPA: DUF1549 and DUF1553 domain-containing protein [Pirellulales bacterium]|nr:DUF1549 and DUF1553 domain-containing protein [Pirellulales bacterium]
MSTTSRRGRAAFSAAALWAVVFQTAVFSEAVFWEAVYWETSAKAGDVPAVSLRDELDAAALTALIDRELAARWEAEGIDPAPPADDAEFLRRVSLDIVGKIPRVSDVRAFLDDHGPDKRRRLVEQLLESGTHAAHFANAWRELLLPGANNNLETRGLAPPFEAWLKIRFSTDTPYDRWVTELLTSAAAAQADGNPLATRASVPSPSAFYQFNERKPESLAANTSRVFLGTQVQCAQCHDHPFARWKQQQFWAMAAFFGAAAPVDNAAQNEAVEVEEGRTTEAPAASPAPASPATDTPATGTPATGPAAGLSIKIPETDTIVEAKFLDGSSPTWRPGDDPRLELTRWIVSRDNPYFARAAVNRIWEHFFGRGLVDPVDDMDEKNPPSHPELFAELARQFVYHGYDSKYLIRAITSSRAYQLTSRTDSGGSDDPQNFARMPLRRMTPEQLYDSLAEATGHRDTAPRQQGAVFGVETGRAAFQAKFADASARRSEAQTSILQALSLMNGTFVADATSLERSETLAAIVELEFLDTPARIEALFMASLNRPCEPGEAERFATYVDAAGPDGKNAALADVFWALLNSAEFIMNH